ncbi:MAG: PspC domain-containing protein [Bacillota bacterium]
MERLHRSKRNKVIFGVCGGLSEYLRIDVTLVRIVAILVTFAGPGLLLYIIAALVMPADKGYEPGDSSFYTGQQSYDNNYTAGGCGRDGEDGFAGDFGSAADDWSRPPRYDSEKKRFVIGAVCLGLGVLFLIKQFLPALFNLEIMVPVLLIIIGGIILYRGRKY